MNNDVTRSKSARLPRVDECSPDTGILYICNIPVGRTSFILWGSLFKRTVSGGTMIRVARSSYCVLGFLHKSIVP